MSLVRQSACPSFVLLADTPAVCSSPGMRPSARSANPRVLLLLDAGAAAASASLPAPGQPSAPAADAAAGAHEKRRLQTEDLMAALRLEVR